MKRILPILVAVASLGPLTTSSAFGGGDEVVVVYNSRQSGSKALADYYAKQRNVPKSQVFGFALTTNENISRKEFHDDLQMPLAKKLEKNKLWRHGAADVPGTNGKPVHIEGKTLESKIRYLVLCYGVPLRIENEKDYFDPREHTVRPELRKNGAAVDSELAVLPLLDQNPPISGPLRNVFYGTTNATWMNPTNGLLMVTRLDGPSLEIARGLVDKALAAEKNGLWGRAYFDLRNTPDPGLKAGDDWIRGAAKVAKKLGFETVVDDGPGTFPASFPMSQIAFYEGWYRQDVSGPFTLPKVEFMPGAFAYHLHSYSAVSLRTTSRGWVGPLLAKGATCTMGCVDEPFLSGTPNVAVFTDRLIVYRFTFGEAAYASQPVLSWQTTMVGDPLYRPFGKDPQKLHEELQQRHSKLLEWSYLRLVNLNLARGTRPMEVIGLLENLALTKQSAVLSEKLADLYSEEGKPSSAAFTYAQALKLDPSPEQRIRLRLTLGEKLLALKRDEEAYADYQTFLEESPDYPNLLSIYRKLLPLAQKLGKKDDAEKYESQIQRLTAPAEKPK